MKRNFKTGLTAVAAGFALASPGAWAATSFVAEQLYRDGSTTTGAAAPIHVVPIAAVLGGYVPEARNADGSVTHQQYTDAMERRWNGLPKNSAGDVPAHRADAAMQSYAVRPGLWTPNY